MHDHLDKLGGSDHVQHVLLNVVLDFDLLFLDDKILDVLSSTGCSRLEDSRTENSRDRLPSRRRT